MSMFLTKKSMRTKFTVYIGVRVTDAENEWLLDEMRRTGLTMSDLIRAALATYKES